MMRKKKGFTEAIYSTKKNKMIHFLIWSQNNWKNILDKEFANKLNDIAEKI